MLLYCSPIQFSIYESKNESGLAAFPGGLHIYIKETAYLFSLWNIRNEKVKKNPNQWLQALARNPIYVIVNCYNVLLLFVLQDK